MKKITSILLCGLILILSACEKDTESSNFAPVVTTGTASNIYRMGATLSGSITLTETNTAKEYGILLSSFESMAEPTEYPVKDGSTNFDVLVQGLESGETYYFCAYASSGYSTAKSQIKSFTTTNSNAPVFNDIILQSKDEKSCTIYTELLDEGGSELLMTGFVWGEAGSGDPTIKSNVVNVELQGSKMSATIKGMEPNKTYLVRAYAVNAQGVGYSNSLSVTTNTATVPFLSNVLPLDSTDVSISVQSSVIAAGLGEVTEFGFCYSSESKESTTAHLVVENVVGDSNEFTALINNLKSETTYYIRAYAVNKEGTGYSETYVYTTPESMLIEGSEGNVYVEKAGGLGKFVDETNKFNITKLKISGYLNGDDIRLIREMAGRDVRGRETAGRLVDLDISEASIVAGGGAYLLGDETADKYTADDIVGERMFHKTILENIILPVNVTSIGELAFYECFSLPSITIPDGVTLIDEWAFYGCSSLVSINIPDKVTSIGASAFDGCSVLKSITIGRGLTFIGAAAFYRCNELHFVYISDLTAWCNIDFEREDANPLHSGGILYLNGKEVEHLVIPNGVTKIKDYLFMGCNLITIEIPESVTSIGNSAFKGCAFSSINIPNSVTSIGNSAFQDCPFLLSIIIPDGVTEISHYSFCNCNSLTSVTLGSGVTLIGEEAFYNCRSLSEVTCNAITPPTLFSRALGNNANLTTLYVPTGCASAYNNSDWAYYFEIIDDGESHGSYKNGVATIEETGTLSTLIPESEKYTITELKVVGLLNGDDIRYIREMAGRDINGNKTDGRLVNLDISEATIVQGGEAYCIVDYEGMSYYTSTDIIGDYMFSETILENIILPINATSINHAAFSSCSSLKSINIPNGVTIIGSSAFNGCRSLTSINIPDNVTSIGASAFASCSSLSSITIPNSVTEIGQSTFYGCSSLKNVTISSQSALISIGYYAFFECSSLTSITIPKGVVSIDGGAFQHCVSLSKVTCNATTPPTLSFTVFEDIASPSTLFVPTGSSIAYSESDWAQYFTTIEEK